MQPIYLALLLTLLLSACSKERQTLNRIQGTFETIEFIITAPGTDSVLYSATPTFEFGECAPRDTRCTMTVTDSDSTVYRYRYEYNVDVASGIEQIGFTPEDGKTWSIGNNLSRVLHNHFDFELDKGELRLVSPDSRWTRDSIKGFDHYDIFITATKR